MEGARLFLLLFLPPAFTPPPLVLLGLGVSLVLVACAARPLGHAAARNSKPASAVSVAVGQAERGGARRGNRRGRGPKWSMISSDSSSSSAAACSPEK
jgi:hypothetical protein